ncbi:MAG TPA: peptidoglycan -binding protein [Alphaproteobacteria bacterium]|nr:peptidoglycan -binding protein [Alphaproteobacteria bacterium]
MAFAANRRQPRSLDIWPGFVDALATLIMVIVFVLMIYTLFQFHLKDVIAGRDQALERLAAQIEEIADQLAFERTETARLRGEIATLSGELTRITTVRDRLLQELAAAQAKAEQAAAQSQRVSKELEDAYKAISADKEKIEVQLRELDALRRNVETLSILRDELEKKLAEQGTQLQREQQQYQAQIKLTEDAQLRADILTRQLAALRDEMARLNAALEASEAKSKEQQVQIADLGRRLNLALASKVEELARYRSEFFGRLREALGDRADIRIVGDRFVFQSEVLFPSGSADLQPEGQRQLAQLAVTLQDVARRIPAEINWVLQVDGHTDRRPISTSQFPSNWELSSARAISVIKFLISRGIAPDRLSATGFGEFHPLDVREDEIGFRRNRRIELKLTSR